MSATESKKQLGVVKGSTIRLDAIGVGLAPGEPASLTHVRAVG